MSLTSVIRSPLTSDKTYPDRELKASLSTMLISPTSIILSLLISPEYIQYLLPSSTRLFPYACETEEDIL